MQFITFLSAERPSQPLNECWTGELQQPPQRKLQRLIVLIAECDGPADTVIAYGIDPDHVDPTKDTIAFERRLPTAQIGALFKRIVDGQPFRSIVNGVLDPESVDVTPVMPPTQGPKVQTVLTYAAALRIDEKLAQVGASRIGGTRGLESASRGPVEPQVRGVTATDGVTRLVASSSVVRVTDGSGRHGSHRSRRLIVVISDPGIGHDLVAHAIDPVGGEGGHVVFEGEIPRANLGAFIKDVVDGHRPAPGRIAGDSTAVRGGLGLDGVADIPDRSSRDAVRRVVLALAASIDSDQRLADAVASGEPDRLASNAP
jgi:hypothetical protein